MSLFGLVGDDEESGGGAGKAAGAAGMAGGPYAALIAAAAKIAGDQMTSWQDQATHASENRAIANIKIAAAEAKAARYGQPLHVGQALSSYQQLEAPKSNVAGLGAALQALGGSGDNKSSGGGSQADIVKSDWFKHAGSLAAAGDGGDSSPDGYDLEDPWKVR